MSNKNKVVTPLSMMSNNALPLVFIFGLYRSGTTLVSRLLNGDSRLASASDPMRPFFNSYTNFLRNEIGEKTSLFAPTNEGFRDNPEYYMKLACSNFRECANAEDTDKILKQVVTQSKSYSPIFSDHINSNYSRNKCSSWKDILEYLIDSLIDCYQEEHHSALAIKEVWTLEIAYSLLKYFKDRVKIIAVMRDPADIFASSKTNAGNYPLLYIARHWRKNIAIANDLKEKYPSQVHLLRYEELCANPLKRYNTMISNILSTDCNSPLDQLPLPKDDNGNLFIKNSSYDQVSAPLIIDKKSVGKYSTILSTNEKQWVKYLCRISYLGNLGFKSLGLESGSSSKCEPLEVYPTRDKSTVADWFNDYYPSYENESFLEKHLSLERERFKDALTSSLNPVTSMKNITKQA